jgi:hypothetical protein
MLLREYLALSGYFLGHKAVNYSTKYVTTFDLVTVPFYSTKKKEQYSVDINSDPLNLTNTDPPS